MPQSDLKALSIQNKDWQRGAMILLVGKESTLWDMVTHAVHLAGYTTAETPSEQAALDWLQRSTDTGVYPAVIVFDPPRRGEDIPVFLAHLQPLWPPSLPLPTVIRILADHARAKRLDWPEGDYILPKPFHIRELLVLLKESLVGGSPPQAE